MNIILSTGLLAVMLVACTTHGKIKNLKQTTNDLQKNYLKGKVRSIRATPYEAVEKSGVIKKDKVRVTNFENSFLVFNEQGILMEEKYYKENGSLDSKTTYQYDDSGNKIEERLYLYISLRERLEGMLFNNPFRSNLKNKTIYKYDDKENLIEQTWYIYGKLWEHITYKYDDKGNLSVRNHYSENGILGSKETYKYDDKGNEIEANDFNGAEILDYKQTYKYDAHGKKIETNYYQKNGIILGCKETYEYDAYGNMIDKNTHTPNGKLIDKHTWKYDDKGKVIEEYNYNLDRDMDEKNIYSRNEHGDVTRSIKYKDKELRYESTYQYEYDEQGNWTKQIEYVTTYEYRYDSQNNWTLQKVLNNEPTYITEREIVYY